MYTLIVIGLTFGLCVALYWGFSYLGRGLKQSPVDSKQYQQSLCEVDSGRKTSPEQDCLFSKMGITDKKIKTGFKSELTDTQKSQKRKEAATREEERRMSLLYDWDPKNIFYDD